MLELCGLVDARVVDHDGVYDPRHPNDRLLLGMKGSISEFELGVLRTRMVEAARAKARRVNCVIPPDRLPVGSRRRGDVRSRSPHPGGHPAAFPSVP
ncbi:recombinase family protein [Paracoccus aerodenitrificans]|nr:recombinase family protein [Paracoccus aerodenitrificans]WBU64740.1 recombinase family protein [Paracoccus aerodenitrificans]